MTAAYYADLSRYSASMLKDYARSPLYFKQRYVTRTLPAPEPSKEMRQGSALHALVLQPETFHKRFAVAPDCDRRTKEGKAIYTAFLSESLGKTVLSFDEYTCARNMAEALIKDPVASDYLCQSGDIEQPIEWECPETGLPLKGLPDKVIKIESAKIVLDIKSMDEPTPEYAAMRVVRLKYHRQMAHYLQGVRLTGFDPVGGAVLLCVRNQPPYDVFCYPLDPIFLRKGREELLQIKRRLKESLDTGLWLHPAQLSPTTLKPPRWYYDEDYGDETDEDE